MKPDDFYSAQLKLTKQLTRALAPIILPLVGVRITGQLIALLAQGIFPTVSKSRDAQKALAEKFYVEAKKAALPDNTPIDRPDIRDYAVQALESGLRGVLHDGREFTQEDVNKVVGVADQHSRNAARNQTLAYSFADDDVLGWARIDPKPPTCSFCTLLISRGPVYSTAKTAGERNKYHAGCTCIPVLVFENQRDSWEGRDKYLEALALYKKHQGDMKAFRRAVEQRNETASVQRREQIEQDAKQPQ